jgi:putative ABC transport system permease protein
MTRLHYRFAWQDAKQGSARLRVLLLCLVLGVGLMASLGSLTAAINASLQEDASTLLGGDILITLTHRPATRDEKALLASLGEVTTMINARSMALSAAGQRRLVEIKAVDASYPLYGEWRINPLSARDAVLSTYQPPYPLLVVPAFLDSLGVAMGDSVTIAGWPLPLRVSSSKSPMRWRVV